MFFVRSHQLSRICCTVLLLGSAFVSQHTYAQTVSLDPAHSIARTWNEALLSAIRNDRARPTVHARNLFHSSVVSYDAWAVFSDIASPWLLGRQNQSGTPCEFSPETRQRYQQASDVENSRLEVISYANYRLLSDRFSTSPRVARTLVMLNQLMSELGYDISNTSTDITNGEPAALGNYLADCMIRYGNGDGSNQINFYANRYYQPVNPPLDPTASGGQTLPYPNRWQPLSLQTFIGQSGIQGNTPEFIGAEWGNVNGFALSNTDRTINFRNGQRYPVYHDPGSPALLSDDTTAADDYSWGHSLVALWSAHLDPADGITIDISPSSRGNNTYLPETLADLRTFYQAMEGGTADPGHSVNPTTGNAYAPNVVLRGDYTRVLAEYWADGPDSETPPGHWFTIYNEMVADHPLFNRRFYGEGEPLSRLDFDIRTYFILGAAMHDAAIAAWSIKGWYDYVRPISALRHLATLGQSTDPQALNYDPFGLPLVQNRIESVAPTDPLAGVNGVNIGKLKVRAWRGPEFIGNGSTDTAGVGWILIENWWPYQPDTFVTPPFAGYVSGHSTFSRTAAEVLTAITGDEFFPGGMAEFVAEQNSFLKFERGPTEDIRLQWATYRDASDQTSLSRIWGGIHPPVDDIPGRKIGVAVAADVLARSQSFLDGAAPLNDEDIFSPEDDNNPDQQSSSGGGGCTLNPYSTTRDPTMLLLLLLAVFSLRRSMRLW